jgi:hypothetical protein
MRPRRIRRRLRGEGGIEADAVVVGPEDMLRLELLAAIDMADAFIGSRKVDPKDLAAVREARDTVARHLEDLHRMHLAIKRGDATPGLAPVDLVVQRAVRLIHTQAGIRDHKKRATDAARAQRAHAYLVADALEKVLGRPPFVGREPRPKELVKPVSDQMLADGFKPKKSPAKGETVVAEWQIRYALRKRKATRSPVGHKN